jgi:hypothetical protein
MAGGVKVLDASGQAIEVDATEATEGIASGRFTPADEQVRVVSGDNRTGRVSRDKLSTALAQGWTLASEEQAAAKKLRREASSTTGTLKHGALAAARGASLGATDLAAKAFGMSSQELEAGQEALGGAGTALEVGGALAATALTGGTAGAAQGAVRAGSLSARLAGGAARAVAAPSRLLARAAGATERALVGQGEATLGRRVAAGAAGEALDGALGGLAGAVNESVIHDKDLTAEALVGGALAGGVFGGAAGGGMALGTGALSRALRGVELKRGGQVPDDAVREVISRDTGVAAGDVPDALLDAAKSTDDGALARWAGRFAETTAPLSGADPAIAKRVAATIAADPKWARDVYNRKPQLEQEMASTFQDLLPRVQGSLKKARLEAGGESKYRAAAAKMPPRADLVTPRLSDELRTRMVGRFDQLDNINAREAHTAFDGRVREARALLTKATEESGLSRRTLTANSARGEGAPRTGDIVGEDATHYTVKWSSGSRTRIKKAAVGQSGSKGYTWAPHQNLTAADSFRAFDRMKRDLGKMINWGPPKLGDKTKEVDTNKELVDLYDMVKRHLEDERLFGDMATAQKAINAKQAAALRAGEALKQAGKGSGLGSLYNPDGSMNLRAAMNLTRQYGRVGGSETVAKLDEALEAELDYLRTVEQHMELTDATKASIREAEDSVVKIREQLTSQRRVADFLADNESIRNSQGDRSVSLGAGAATAAATIGGAMVAGPVGALAGAAAGAIFRLYTTARAMASLLALTGSFGKRFDGGRLVAKLRARTGGVGAAVGAKVKAAAVRARGELEAAGRSGVRASAFQLAEGTPEERAKKVRELSRRVVDMSSLESLRRAMGPELEALSAGAPETAAAIETTLGRAAAFLASKLTAVTQGNPFSGSPGHVNPQEVDRWLRYRGAILAPGKAVKRILDGTVTHEEIEALEAVYPRHMEQLRQGAMDACADAAGRGDPLPYQARLSLSRALDIPLDDMLTPERIAAVQALYATAPQPDPAPRTATKGADSLDPGRMATPTEQIAAGELR